MRDLNYDLKNKPLCIIISREIVPRYIPPFLYKRLCRTTDRFNTIWDFDDDIIALGEISKREWQVLQEKAKCIIATHDYLKELLLKEWQYKCKTMMTTDGTCSKEMYEAAMNTRLHELDYENIIRIIWVGTSGNLVNLKLALPGINAAAKGFKSMGKKVYFYIVSNLPYESNCCDNIEIINVTWNRKDAIKQMLCAHIGIMPLVPTDFSKGKGGFKLIQYLSCGVPVISSSEGINKAIVDSNVGILANNTKAWCDAVKTLVESKIVWNNYSNAARRKYEEYYSFESNLNKWENIIVEWTR